MKRMDSLRVKYGTTTGRHAACFLTLLLCALVTLLCAPAADAAAGSHTPDYTSFREVPVPTPDQVGPDRPAVDLSAPTTPPDDPQVGDSWLWWLWIHEGMPHFEERMCTVRGKTDRGYVVVEDSQWQAHMFQDDVDLILERWENSSIGPYPEMGIYEIDSTYFGAPPDELDEDPRVYLMYFDFGIPADGFFFWFDEYLDGQYPPYHSNECEVLYLNPSHGPDPSGDYMISVVSHEFQHMIHWKYDDNEDTWVNEGLSELAMFFYGHPDHISAFNTNADNPLTEWGGYWADYIKTYLWTLYFYERYGGHETIYATVHEPANSIYGYENVLDDYGYTEDFADVFADWAIANFLDDPTLEDGRFGYVGEELPEFFVMGTYSTYPVPNYTRTVGQWATDYYRFESMDDFTALELNFDGSDNNVFAVWGLAMHADGTTEVHRMTLDGDTQSGTLVVPGLHDPDDEVILVVSGISSYGTPTYIFNAAAGGADVPDLTDGVSGPGARTPRITWMNSSPNPFRDETSLTLSWEGETTGVLSVDLYDAQGRFVQALRGAETTGVGAGGTGHVTLTWDGREASGHMAPPGIYYARARLGSVTSERSIVRLP